MKVVIMALGMLLLLVHSKTIYSVEYNHGQFQLRQGSPTPVTLAWGNYEDEVMKDGWGKLYINTNPAFTSHSHSLLMYYAAGYLEGALTWSQISDHYLSWYDYTFKQGTQPPSDATKKFVNDQHDYAKQMISQNPDCEYYQSLARVIAQFDGMLDAITKYATPGKALDKTSLLFLQGAGDMYEIIPATTPSLQVDWQSLRGEELYDKWHQTISCSALIKAPSDWSDVFAGHTTWTSYQNLLRVYKYYQFTGPYPYRVSFSAKPGMMYSKDDFYVLPDQNMVVMETTNSLLNKELLKQVQPKTLLTWHRVCMANQLATNGDEWTDIFTRDNSGTYNNQYMVIDMKTVANGAPTAGFLWISETMPGKFKRSDVTSVFISNGNYWPSFNIPFDTEIYEYAGYTADMGDQFSYKSCARYQIFAQQQSKVTDAVGLQKVLRYNDQKNDPLSQNRPDYAIASRYDLRSPNASPFGSIDGKVTSKKLTAKNQAWIQSGPSYDTQPVFKWSDWPGVLHLGQPEQFQFPWVLMQEQ